ncbi:acyltransferase domain-containing protein [Streptomyces varsoviensis]|uniref:acyltransferase domain-containing protein n=1 Tax=Streptomyces varsoviensis TaxID=67373 RepID=UPI0034033D17
MTSTDNHTGSRMLRWAAPDDEAEEEVRDELAARLRAAGGDGFARVADDWGDGPGAGPVRGALVAAGRDEALAALGGTRPGRCAPRHPDPARPVALLLAGQGAQQPGMASGLYGTEPAFTAAMDAYFERHAGDGESLRDEWLAARPGPELDDITRAQPLLFAVGYAVGRMLLDWGVRPDVLLGHSVGEVAAATLAGVFTLDEAAEVMAERIDQLGATPPGGMLAVAASAERLAPYVAGPVAVGAVNSPSQVMLAGPDPELLAAERALRRDGFTVRRAKATTAFHSPAVSEAAALAVPTLTRIGPRAPRIRMVSAYTAAELTARHAESPRFWATQPAEPVLFGPALDALLAEGDHFLIDGGPAQSLAALARRHRAVVGSGSTVAAALPAGRRTPADDLRTTLTLAARLWAEGRLGAREAARTDHDAHTSFADIR